jgi:phosphoserine phosphatase RsbU/P
MRIRRIFLITISILIFLAIFFIDILRKTSPEKSGLVRNILLILGFTIIYFILNKLDQNREKSIVTKIGNVLLISAGLLVCLGCVSFLPNFQFTYLGDFLSASNYGTVIFTDIFSIVAGIVAIYLLVIIKNLIFSYRRKETKRNFLFTLLSIGSTIIFFFWLATKNESSFFLSFIVSITVLSMLINSFRLPWIVYLSKKEKYYTIAYYLLILPLIITTTVVNGGALLENNSSRMLFYFSPMVKEFIFLISLFTSLYFSIAFISTIFHIPTQDIFDRKIVEISSLHNLSKLVTQIFDFDDLIDNITKIALDVSEADCAWIDIKKVNKDIEHPEYAKEKIEFDLAGFKNITKDEIDTLNANQEVTFRDRIMQSKKVFYISDFSNAKSHKSAEILPKKLRSLVVVPLVSHSELIGILYMGKSFSFGFDKEYLNIINTFADQVTISIENSKLIEKSLEKERMERELLLAQKMQRKLLPNKSPEHECLDLSAISIPAYEVGGDYYDFSSLENGKLGIIVGDVSGKGISAAFYMAVMKGIFQALTKVYCSPKEFLIKANIAINEHIEKKSFVSLIYGILDLEAGILHLSRAGHCPMIYVSSKEARYYKPDGLGVGLDNGRIFSNITEEIEINLEAGSICAFYTDGIPEARNKINEEFGYDRLLEAIVEAKERSAQDITAGILKKVKEFTKNDTEYDDITLVCFKWNRKE